MNLNKKGYMLVEIILASALAFAVAYFLLNLTYKFKNIDEELYTSINYETTKSLISKNIMNDIERGNLSNFYYDESSNILDFKISIPTIIDNKIENIVENRRLKITDNTITYGITNTYKSDNFDKKNVSFYQKTLPKNLKISKVEFVNNEDDAFGLLKIKVDSLYDNNNYEFKILLTKHNNLDEAVGNCITITLNNNGGTGTITNIYYSYDKKKFYNNNFCVNSELTKLSSIPNKTENRSQEIDNAIKFNTNEELINKPEKAILSFNGYYYQEKELIDANGNINLANVNSLNINSDVEFSAQWNTPHIVLPYAAKKDYYCEGWYSDEELTNKVKGCGEKWNLPTEETTLYAKLEFGTNYTLTKPAIEVKTLQDAINKVSSDSVITMKSSDTITNETININDKGMTINLNNKRLQLEGRTNINATTNTNLTLKNGAIVANNNTSKYIINTGDGKFNLDSIKLHSCRNGIYVSPNTNLSIKSGTYSSEPNYNILDNKGKVTIEDGEFNDSIINNGTININGGNFRYSATDKVLLSNLSSGKIIINNKNKPEFIAKGSTILENLGTATIYGGWFEGCSKILILNGTSKNTTGKLTIGAGTFKAGKDCLASSLLTNYSSSRLSKSAVTISGGTFWNGGTKYALQNRDMNTSGYGISVKGTIMKAYAASYYVVYANSGNINLDGGNYYSTNSQFYKASPSATIKIGNNYNKKKDKLSEPL